MPMGAQPKGNAFAVAQPPPRPLAGLGAQMQQGTPAPSQLAAATAAIHINARLAPGVWWSMAGKKCYIAQWKWFSVADELTPEIPDFFFKTVAGVAPAITKQPQNLPELQ